MPPSIVVVLNMMVGLTLPPHGLLLFVNERADRHAAIRNCREIPPSIEATLAVVLAVTSLRQLALRLPG